MFNFLIFICLTLLGCNPPPVKNNQFTLQEICGRDDNSNSIHPLIYRVRTPKNWIRKNPDSESISDTTKPLCELYITENEDQKIRITIHNFPVDAPNQRIPPGAQISRWKSQLKNIEAESVSIIPQSFGGFFGFLFEGVGSFNDVEIKVMGWAMQIAPEHYSILTATLNVPSITPIHASILKQMRAEYTIKVTGPKALMERHRSAIIEFARSFELIQEIPSA